ncbi:hypothetical protein P7K49_002127 [Saguinus oedipus]|uniref:Multiprotein bridging factor 1 N-terminal domain-containing protein n=1 Tax=Saguinus oedipus TaxID=9490 RepID=A0ABQ9WHE1_SAGOE|nr:hypothetical protein P7K49_002127 [Saguinus oedipus]
METVVSVDAPQAILAAQRRGEDVETSKKCRCLRFRLHNEAVLWGPCAGVWCGRCPQGRYQLHVCPHRCWLSPGRQLIPNPLLCSCLTLTPGAAGQNKQHSITKNTAKLDRETEELHHDRVTLEVGKVIQQGRQSKGLTQKDLATVRLHRLSLLLGLSAQRGGGHRSDSTRRADSTHLVLLQGVP